MSLLPLRGELLEKIVYRRIIHFLNMHNILIQQQNGFRAGHSTIDTVAKFTNDLFMNINGSKCTLAVFIDLKKVFDMVNHKLLINKLNIMGIRGLTFCWVNS